MKRRGVLESLVFRLVAATLLVMVVAGAPAAALADEAPERNIMLHYGLGVGSVLATLVYGPVKVMYATLGSITGGLAYLLTGGRLDVPREIIQPAVRGDYVVTPEHLTFNQPLLFVGKERALDKSSGDENYE
ncbi:MAG TPA: hypothetical protein VKF60_19515 [Myxococcota bacterium]|nr:hypothetical protein [Myxococcota bacterium]